MNSSPAIQVTSTPSSLPSTVAPPAPRAHDSAPNFPVIELSPDELEEDLAPREEEPTRQSPT
jgi:hypothetical protein